jgi:hypothetical protein
MTDISVVFAIGLAVGFAVGYAVYFLATSSSRNEATLPSIAVGAELSSWPDLGEWWPSRLVATPSTCQKMIQVI